MDVGIGIGFVIALVGGLVGASIVDRRKKYDTSNWWVFAGGFGAGIFTWLISIFISIPIASIHTGYGTYNGKICSNSTSGAIWKTNNVAIKTHMANKETVTFAVLDPHLFEQFKQLQEKGVDVEVNCSYNLGYLPWIGDSFIAMSVTESP